MISCLCTNKSSSSFSSFSWHQSNSCTMLSISSSSSLTSIQTLVSMVTPHPNITHFLNVKLDKRNYLLWRSQFLPLLKLHNLEGLVDGTFPCQARFLPSTEKDAQLTINLEYTNWIKLDQMLLCWLISSLTEAVLAHVVGITTSRDM